MLPNIANKEFASKGFTAYSPLYPQTLDSDNEKLWITIHFLGLNDNHTWLNTVIIQLYSGISAI